MKNQFIKLKRISGDIIAINPDMIKVIFKNHYGSTVVLDGMSQGFEVEENLETILEKIEWA